MAAYMKKWRKNRAKALALAANSDNETDEDLNRPEGVDDTELLFLMHLP